MIIDTTKSDQQLNDLSIKMDKYIEDLFFSNKQHYRIITDKEIKFPRNYEIMNHDRDMELSNISWDKHPNRGWGKPDKMIGNIEVRYLLKQFKPAGISK